MSLLAKCLYRYTKNDVANRAFTYLVGNVFNYKSAVSLENLYPTSTLKLYTPTFVPDDSANKFNGYIPTNQLEITYSRSSGPGGQNVNKVNTKVGLRFQLKKATWLSEDVKAAVLKRYPNRITKEGYLVIKSDLTRSQHLNLADAMAKLRTLIREAIVEPAEPSAESVETKRRCLFNAAKKRLAIKRHNSQKRKDSQFSNDF